MDTKFKLYKIMTQ